MTGKSGRKEPSGQIDFILVAIILSLILFGFIMLFSASSPSAAEGGIISALMKQGILLGLGLVFLIAAASRDYHMYADNRVMRFLFRGAVIAMMFVPLFGRLKS